MAFGPSITFYAPNWEPGVVRSSEAKRNPVPSDLFRSWLRSLGFKQHHGPGNNFTLDLIDIYLHDTEEEVVFMTVEFGMPDDALDRVSSWQEFAEQLCSKWDFS